MGIISRKEERKVSDEIEKRCMEAGYTFSHFTDGCYKGKDSKLVFRCDLHGDQTMSYHNFIYHKQSCPVCASFKRNRVELDSGIGKYSKDRPDNLYIIKFNNDYIKVGRTFNMVSRVSALKRVSKIIEAHDEVQKRVQILEFAKENPEWMKWAFADLASNVESAVETLDIDSWKEPGETI